MEQPFQLVLGSHNQKKLHELRNLIEWQSVHLSTLADFPDVGEVDETGTTFEENARLKAVGYATATGHWVLAEDSGLCVAALDGAPGVYSARFSGAEATDESNNRLLLERMVEVPPKDRAAHYHCHISVSDADGYVHADASGTCQGRIIAEPRGNAGFGYDPLFEIPEYDLTFAELGDRFKSVLSHRARAWRAMMPKLNALIANHQSAGV